METTTIQGHERFTATSRATYRHDDEEYEIPPRWLSSRIRAGFSHPDVLDEVQYLLQRQIELECEFYREVC